ncbi:apolipoprotein N-acyltransferase, partial [uncultured Alistipes sp.]
RRSAGRWAAAAGMLLVPAAVSLGIWWSWQQPGEGTAEVSLVQPDVDCYDKFNGRAEFQERNIVELLAEVPAGAEFILLPETAVPGHYWEPELSDFRDTGMRAPYWTELSDSLRAQHPGALLVTGANTLRYYAPGSQPRTARQDPYGAGYYDVFNSAVGLDSAGRLQLHHKGKLVIGVENTPTVLFDILQFLVIDLGGVVGQIGMGQHGTAFDHGGTRVGPAICYEGLYGDFFGDFVRRGAQFMAIISNDGWWGDTPGYKHLFTISRLRAIEHRRAIARSANTGMSGFISARGDVGQTLGWEKRGVITAAVPLNSELTFYTRYGDYLGRISEYLMLLCVLYYVAYRVRKKNHLVK